MSARSTSGSAPGGREVGKPGIARWLSVTARRVPVGAVHRENGDRGDLAMLVPGQHHQVHFALLN